MSATPVVTPASPARMHATATVSISYDGAWWASLPAKSVFQARSEHNGGRVPFRVDARLPLAITIERSSCEMLLRKHQPMRLGLVGPIAVVAMLVVGAEGASGAPELLYCMANASGKYETRAKCEEGNETGTTLGWERETGPLAGETVTVDFTSGKGHLSTPKHNIECTSDEGSGEVTGARTFAKVVVSYKGCKDTIVSGACNSTEPLGAAGEILTDELSAELVDLKAGGALPGGLLSLPTAGTAFTKISCVGGLVKETVTGEIIGEFAGATINTMTASSELKFEENAGKQLWTKVEEGVAVHELTAFGESAYEVGKETVKLLVSGTEESAELMFP